MDYVGRLKLNKYDVDKKLIICVINLHHLLTCHFPRSPPSMQENANL